MISPPLPSQYEYREPRAKQRWTRSQGVSSPVKYRNIVDLRLRFRCVFSASLKSGDVVIRRYMSARSDAGRIMRGHHAPGAGGLGPSQIPQPHTAHIFQPPHHLRMCIVPTCRCPRCTSDSEIAAAPPASARPHMHWEPSRPPNTLPTPCLIRLTIPHTPHISDRPMRESTALRGLKACACNEARNRGALLPCQLS